MQNESKPTPGPWAWRDERTNLGTPYPEGYIAIEAGPDWNPEQVASVVPNTFDGDAVANARLIAAAPDLLEAAKTAADLLHESTERRVLRAAIAKAEGVSE